MVGAVLSLFLLVTKRLYGKDREWSIGQIKTCCKKQHVKIDDMKEMSDSICGKVAVAEVMGEQGIMFYAGDARKQSNLIEDVYNQLLEMWNNVGLCGQYREKMGKLVDGKGVERICNCIMNNL